MIRLCPAGAFMWITSDSFAWTSSYSHSVANMSNDLRAHVAIAIFTCVIVNVERDPFHLAPTVRNGVNFFLVF